MDDNEIKAITIVGFFLDTVLFGCLPYFLVGRPGAGATKRSVRIRTTVISYLNCFAGGVFLGACMLHLMVEGRTTLDEYFEMSEIQTKFPVFECITAGGFFLIAFIEVLAHKCMSGMETELKQEDTKAVMAGNTDPENVSPSCQLLSSCLGCQGVGVCGGRQEVTEVALDVIKPKTAKVAPAPASQWTETARSRPTSQCDNTQCTETARSGEADYSDDDGEAPVEIDAQFQLLEARPMRAFLMLGALSFHTMFDGLAVGLQQEQAAIWQMFAAICFHKSLVNVCLGLQIFLVYRKQPCKAVTCMTLFALIPPIGVGIGMYVMSGDIDDYAKTLSRGVLEGVSTGTFLYVCFFEILAEELGGDKKGLLRLLLVVLGFASTALPKVI